MSAMPPRHCFTVPQYEKMIDNGILNENDRVELIRGEIVAKMAIGDAHLGCVNRMNRLLVRSVWDRGVISVQNPVVLADSEPEPDIAVLVPRADDYASAKPRAADVLLLIEVADSSLDYDRQVKAPLYAENSITEYWIVNLEHKCLEVHRQPRPDGTYADVRTLRVGDTADIAALPGLSIGVAEIL
ncbi:MAG TPA: Uma2 family endonuclease [Gemmataceae bacterium]|jgi:Uma2 family endonuclease|nr:Uma2 family endonuclease [Gemmataceae bacterium]